MRAGDETTLASTVQRIRARQGLNQSELAEAAQVSTKTIQRLEAGKPIAGSSRRAVLAALHVDPRDLETTAGEEQETTESPWTEVGDAGSLLERLAAARRVEVELDREGWRRARRQRPWYRQDLAFATRDPTETILDVVDRAAAQAELPPGRAAREEDDLSAALKAAEALGWGLATRFAGPGRLALYIGAPTTVAERTRSPAEPDR